MHAAPLRANSLPLPCPPASPAAQPQAGHLSAAVAAAVTAAVDLGVGRPVEGRVGWACLVFVAKHGLGVYIL